MKRWTLTALAVCLAMPLAVSFAESGHDAVKQLGALNGIALACRYVDEVSRMKAAVVANAPKERSYGLAFDESTNTGFMSFIDQKAPCPAKSGFSQQVDAGVQHLESAFETRHQAPPLTD